jgi:hypothetical protein
MAELAGMASSNAMINKSPSTMMTRYNHLKKYSTLNHDEVLPVKKVLYIEPML